MSKIKSKIIRFVPSDSPDVVTNNLYVEPTGTPLTYDSTSFDVGNTPDGDGYVVVDLATLFVDYDGIYDIGIAAVDDGGNEADMVTVTDVPLDFVAPNPVSGLELL
jgi:hypothetical protein